MHFFRKSRFLGSVENIWQHTTVGVLSCASGTFFEANDMEAPYLSGAVPSTTVLQGRTPVQSAAPVVKTVMPESKAVTAVPEKPAVRVEISGDAQRLAAAQQAMKRVIEKHIAYDEKMRTVIVKTVDQVTGKT
ncbi:MAG: hypothetical protein ACRCXM_08625, partial [Beijerinckiaceae bacterium]